MDIAHADLALSLYRDDELTHRILTMGQSPNEPCLCGSGKKYKKCCGSVVVG